MDRYKIVETISDQEYGTIAKAMNLQTKQMYIIKILRKKFYTWQECIGVREVKALRLFSHPNIIKIKEIIKQKDELYCVYDYYEQSLFDYYQDMRDLCDEFTERQIKEIMFQIISAVHYIHDQKFFHRDLCPETISVTSSPELLFSQNVQVKLSSFNVTREISQRFTQYTDYITTRWYRAPEQLLHSLNYTHKIDIWAIGCIMAELYLMGPLFNGISEQDQLLRIMKVFGTPSQTECPELYNYASLMKFQFPNIPATNLSSILTNASNNAIDLLKHIFKYNPLHRPSCDTILKHPFFSDLNIQNIPSYNTPSNILQKMQKKKEFEDIYQENIKEQIKEDLAQKHAYENLESDGVEDNATQAEQIETNSQKKSQFAKNNSDQNSEVESDNYTPNNTEQSQLQFSHFVKKHLAKQENDTDNDNEDTNKLATSDKIIQSKNNNDTFIRKVQTPK